MQPNLDTNHPVCVSCKKPFLPKNLKRPPKTCSQKCRNSFKYSNNKQALNKQTYLAQQIRATSRKEALTQHLGGKCELCGYRKNLTALCFHHKDPSIKDFGLDSRKLSGRSWESILKEVAKCQLLCLNCHMEVHHPEFNQTQTD